MRVLPVDNLLSLWTMIESRAHPRFTWRGAPMDIEQYYFVAAAAGLLMLIGGITYF